ncbi:SMI1/KNR4 family protein [Flammeovirgaceae bacterium SG7u.111]|nr:SMI1/KNR4 family protein [Flammeovirgaceae bacterium SG7u.132]WPO37803.1 SMI1/KNR4 family protein [Flammeovirgaceae bacterium SG7u.111]
MKLEDIRIIEQELGITLPKHYVKYITNFPITLKELKTQIGELLFLYDNPEQLISTNRFLGFHGSDKFIKDKLCIGENGGGDYYLIDLCNPFDQKVYFFDHEESVEKYYNQEENTWEWNKLESCDNLKEHENEILELFN